MDISIVKYRHLEYVQFVAKEVNKENYLLFIEYSLVLTLVGTTAEDVHSVH